MSASSPKKKPSGKGCAILKVLQPVAAALAAEIQTDRMAPQVDISKPISHVARTLGQSLHLVNLYRQGEFLVSVDSSTGKTKAMRAERFCSWVETYVSIVKPTKEGEPKITSMSADMAAKIMSADQFREGLRELKAVHDVRLPVWEEYNKTVRLLSAGYDEAAKVFTVDSVPYALDMEPLKAKEFFLEILKSYPWSDEGSLDTRRSLAVHMAAVFGNYVRLLFDEGTPKPCIVFNGNQPGTGKSTLARMTLCPVYGVPEDKTLPKSEEELRKELAAFAMARQPYVFFDDVGGRLHSHLLNNFITSPRHGGRKLGTGETFSVPNVSQFFITGNGLKLAPDLARRCLVVDLFCAEEARSRKFDRIITDTWLATDEARTQFLAALWALVKNWQSLGCPRNERLLESFDEWSGVVGGIVFCSGFSDPIQPAPELAMDEQGLAFQRVFCALAATVPDGKTVAFSLGECRKTAEKLELWETLVSGAQDSGEFKAFGVRIRKFKGRQFTDEHGRRFEFGRRKIALGSVYDVTVFAAAPAPSEESEEDPGEPF